MADEDLELSEIEAVDESQSQPEKQVELPEKYRGKSPEELVKMHQEAEKLAGRQAQEVGETRKLVDDLLRSQIDVKPKDKEQVNEVDFFEDPQQAINNAIDSNPRVIAAEQQAANMLKEQNKQKFFGKHPDAMEIVQNPEFRNWVGQSTIRQQLLQNADANFDFDSGNELLSTWKELKAVNIVNDDNIEKQVTDDTIKTVAVDTSGSGETSKKTYSRASLIRLKTSNPRKYESMRGEIELAYKEKRVR